MFEALGKLVYRHCWSTLALAAAFLAASMAMLVRGRGLHVSVYSHYLKVFHLEAIRSLATHKEPRR